MFVIEMKWFRRIEIANKIIESRIEMKMFRFFFLPFVSYCYWLPDFVFFFAKWMKNWISNRIQSSVQIIKCFFFSLFLNDIIRSVTYGRRIFFYPLTWSSHWNDQIKKKFVYFKSIMKLYTHTHTHTSIISIKKNFFFICLFICL